MLQPVVYGIRLSALLPLFDLVNFPVLYDIPDEHLKVFWMGGHWMVQQASDIPQTLVEYLSHSPDRRISSFYKMVQQAPWFDAEPYAAISPLDTRTREQVMKHGSPATPSEWLHVTAPYAFRLVIPSLNERSMSLWARRKLEEACTPRVQGWDDLGDGIRMYLHEAPEPLRWKDEEPTEDWVPTDPNQCYWVTASNMSFLVQFTWGDWFVIPSTNLVVATQIPEPATWRDVALGGWTGLWPRWSKIRAILPHPFRMIRRCLMIPVPDVDIVALTMLTEDMPPVPDNVPFLIHYRHLPWVRLKLWNLLPRSPLLDVVSSTFREYLPPSPHLFEEGKLVGNEH